MKTNKIQAQNYFKNFVSDIKQKILSSQYEALKAVNKELINLYWGFSVQNLWNMRLFYIEYSQNEKLQTLSREVGWSHNVAIFQKCKDNLEREFYIKSVVKFGWSYRVLDNHIDNKSYEKYLLNQTNFDQTY